MAQGSTKKASLPGGGPRSAEAMAAAWRMLWIVIVAAQGTSTRAGGGVHGQPFHGPEQGGYPPLAGRAKPRGLMLHQNLAANIVLERQKNGATASAPQRTRPKAATAAHKAAAHKTRQRSNGRRLPSGGFGSHAEKAAEYASFKAEKASQLNAAKAAAMAKAKMAERLAASAAAKAEEKVLSVEAQALAMFKTNQRSGNASREHGRKVHW